MRKSVGNRGRGLVRILLTTSLLISPLQINSAQAGAIVFQKLSADNYEPNGEVRYDHETRNMVIEINDDNKDIVIVRLSFASSISNSTFASSSTLLRVKFAPTLTNFKGNVGNIWLEAPKTPYQGATKIPAIASAYVSDKSLPTDPRKDMSECKALTWLDDVASRNQVSFEFSRNCFNLPNPVWAVSQIETDMYNSTLIKDIRYTPVEPFYIDMQSVPAPPKIIPKTNQTITANWYVRDYQTDAKGIKVEASSSAGTPLTYASITPTICTVNTLGEITPINEGKCVVGVDAAGMATLNPAVRIFVSVTFTKKTQQLYFDRPGQVFFSEGSIKLEISAESNLPVIVTSTTPKVCAFNNPTTNPTLADFIQSGTCGFKVSQAGNNIYLYREGFADFIISPNPVVKPTPKPSPNQPNQPEKPDPVKSATPTPTPKKIIISGSGTATGPSGGGNSISGGGAVAGSAKSTITCIKPGFKPKPVTAVKPKCPAGYKKK